MARRPIRNSDSNLCHRDRVYGCFAGTLVFGCVELDFVAFVQAGKACALESCNVYKYVVAGLRLDEAEAFCGVEKFNSTCFHI